MSGVEILATQEVITSFGFAWNIFWFIFAAVTIIFTFVIGTKSHGYYGWRGWVAGFVASIIIGVALGICAAHEQQPLGYEKHYKVVVSDSVTVNEFHNKYEVLDKDGEIYVVRER
jgi:hypothetical protein